MERMKAKKKTKIKNFPLHLIVMAILPIITSYGENFGRVVFVDTIRSYVVFVSAAMLSFALTYRFFRNHHQAASIVSFGLFLFYLVMPIQGFFVSRGIQTVSVRILLPVFLLLFIAGTWWGLRRIKKLDQATSTLNLLALSTLILPFFQIASYLGAIIPSGSVQEVASLVEASPPDATDETGFPDVYYIILDAHGRADDILGDYGFDNTPALKRLTEMGFYIAQCSNANYPDATWQSVMHQDKMLLWW